MLVGCGDGGWCSGVGRMGVLSVEVGGLVWTVESLYYEGLVWILTVHDE